MFDSTRQILENQEALKDRLSAIEALLETEITWKVVAERQADEIKELRDRFMARDFQDYATMRAAGGDGIELIKPPKYEPEPGEIIDGTET